jgi:hypothetical protein
MTPHVRSSQLAGAACGAAAYCLAQIPLLLGSTAQDARIEDPGWFLNSGRNAGIIALAIALFAAPVFRRPGASAAHLVAYAGGAALAMTVVLFAIGPGNIFPIVILFGAIVIGVAASVGAALGSRLRA